MHMRIFISYRRLDSAKFACDCFEYFLGRLGQRSVFFDQSSIPPDRQWQEIIFQEIEAANVMLLIVGPEWCKILKERQDWPVDHVRLEIERARLIKRPIVIVLIDGADPPKESDLPDSLRFLAAQQLDRFDTSNPAGAFARLERRLLQFAPAVTAREVWSQAELERRPWFDGRLYEPQVHSSWWEIWNLHDSDLLNRLTNILAGRSVELSPVLISGPENSGRRYLIDCAVRRLRSQGESIQLLRINLDGYEVDLPKHSGSTNSSVVENYLRQQARRLGVESERGRKEVLQWLESNLGLGKDSINTCAALGMLLDLTGSFARIHYMLERMTINRKLKETTILLVSVLDHFARNRRVVVHSDEPVIPIHLREDLLNFTHSMPNLVLVFSAVFDTDVAYWMNGIQSTRMEIVLLSQTELNDWLQQKFKNNPVPDWLPRLLWQGSMGNRGLVVLQLLQLLQDEVLGWDTEDRWEIQMIQHPSGEASSPLLNRLLLPLVPLYEQSPRLHELLRTAALCGELIPLQALMLYLRIETDERDDLTDLVDEKLCGRNYPMFEDCGYHHPGFTQGMQINLYRFRNSLDNELLLSGTTAAWREQEAAKLLEFLEHILPATTRGISNIYLRICDFLSDKTELKTIWMKRLQWWVSEHEADRMRKHIERALNERRLSNESVWQVINGDLPGWTISQQLNLMLAFEQQIDGIPLEYVFVFFKQKGMALLEAACFGDAEQYLREALRIAESYFGCVSTEATQCMNNLAKLLKDTNRSDLAELLVRRALAIDEGNFSTEHCLIARDLNNLSQLLTDADRLAEAMSLIQRALIITENHNGPEHSEVAIRLNNMGGLLQKMNFLAEAEPPLRRAVDIAVKNFGYEHPEVSVHFNNLAGLLEATSRINEAEQLYRHSLVIDEKFCGFDHPLVATKLNNLARVLQVNGYFTEASLLYRRALAINEQAYGLESPAVARDLNNFAQLLQQTNQLEEAEVLLRQAVTIAEASFGPTHTTVATYINNLAQLLAQTSCPAKAEPLMQRALVIFRLRVDRLHPNTVAVLEDYRLLLATMELSEKEINQRVLQAMTMSESIKSISNEFNFMSGEGTSVTEVLAALETAISNEDHASVQYYSLNHPITLYLDQLLGPAKRVAEILSVLDEQYGNGKYSQFYFLPLNKPFVEHLDKLIGSTIPFSEGISSQDQVHNDEQYSAVEFLSLKNPITLHLDALLGPPPRPAV